MQMDQLVSLCKRRGFLFQSSEIYGGLNGFWDYGPLGVELKRNVKETWWRDMVTAHDDLVELLRGTAGPRPAGGVIGKIVGGWLESVMKLLGASTLLFVLWVASVSLFLGISWFSVVDRMGQWCLLGFEKALTECVDEISTMIAWDLALANEGWDTPGLKAPIHRSSRGDAGGSTTVSH